MYALGSLLLLLQAKDMWSNPISHGSALLELTWSPVAVKSQLINAPVRTLIAVDAIATATISTGVVDNGDGTYTAIRSVTPYMSAH
jgi:hypothetical protein